jgi:VIT1/CCC1 family predicted Fe2+/Mn2+ transporter
MSEPWVDHYRDEKDAAFLYRALADAETETERRELFLRLAAVEDRHVERWEHLFVENGRDVPSHTPSGRSRFLAWLARRFGPSFILPLVLAEEGREVEAYLALAQGSKQQRPLQQAAVSIAAESAAHAQELAKVLGRDAEPWHVSGSGGYVRSIVYGFNDGLTANFGLVAGVIGASVAPHIVIITGIAGAMADALSMGSSGYLAAKSEAEVHAHEIELERHELQLMPDLEEQELALIYEAKGLAPEQARQTARAMMQDPRQALEAKVREELQIGSADLTPLADGIVTGTATAVGAFIPIFPFLVMSPGLALWVSLVISMLAHFAIGGARSFFTGRSIWASGRDMFLVGFGVAAAGYLVGQLLELVL